MSSLVLAGTAAVLAVSLQAQAVRVTPGPVELPAPAAAASVAQIKSLLDALETDDRSALARAESLVRAARGDWRLPSRERFELAARLEHAAMRRSLAGRADRDWLGPWEAIERALVAEFPDQSAGHEALLGVALHHPEASAAVRIAAGIVADPSAPTWVVTRARTLIQRHDLVGVSFRALMPAEEGGAWLESLPPGTPVLIYSWATWSPESLIVARRLATDMPAGSLIVGVCLDSEVDLVGDLAGALGPPGILIFDERGREGLVARRLMLDDAPIVLTTDPDGIVRCVDAHLSSPALGGVAR